MGMDWPTTQTSPPVGSLAFVLAALLSSCASESVERRIVEIASREPMRPQLVSSLKGPLDPPLVTAENRVVLENNLADALHCLHLRPQGEMEIVWVGRRLAYPGRYREAVEVFSQGLRIHPGSPRLLRHRGHRYITLREFDKAIEDLAKAAEKVEGSPDEIEPDGSPNPANVPRSTLKTNIYYHLGLAHYLKGELDLAWGAYQKCLELSRVNDDMLCASTHWAYMTLCRLGRRADADALLSPIHENMEILENHAYHRLLMMYKTGEIPPQWRNLEEDSLEIVTAGYGIGNWLLCAGRVEEAQAVFTRLLSGNSWPAFGYISAENDLMRNELSTTETPR